MGIKGTILHKSLQILAYADDDVIIVRYERTVKEAYIKLKKAAQFMEVSNNKTKEKHIIIDNENIDIVNEFQYLGSIVTCVKKINVEINHRITM
jgi:hypothetical protein